MTSHPYYAPADRQQGAVAFVGDRDETDYLLERLRWFPKLDVDVFDRREDAVILVRPGPTGAHGCALRAGRNPPLSLPSPRIKTRPRPS